MVQTILFRKVPLLSDYRAMDWIIDFDGLLVRQPNLAYTILPTLKNS